MLTDGTDTNNHYPKAGMFHKFNLTNDAKFYHPFWLLPHNYVTTV